MEDELQHLKKQQKIQLAEAEKSNAIQVKNLNETIQKLSELNSDQLKAELEDTHTKLKQIQADIIKPKRMLWKVILKISDSKNCSVNHIFKNCCVNLKNKQI